MTQGPKALPSSRCRHPLVKLRRARLAVDIATRSRLPPKCDTARLLHFKLPVIDLTVLSHSEPANSIFL